MAGPFIELTPSPSVVVETYPVEEVDVEAMVVAPTVVLPTPLYVPVEVIITGPQGPPGPAGFEGFTFTYGGSVSPITGKGRQYFETASVIDTVRASVNTAPTGSNLVVDVKKNGTSIFTTTGDRPAITPGTFTDLGGSMSGASLSAGDYLTVDVISVGSVVPGSDLTVTVRVHEV